MKHLYQEINDALYNTYYGINRIEEEELKKSQFVVTRIFRTLY